MNSNYSSYDNKPQSSDRTFTRSMSSSLMIADFDLSRLDSKRQMEIANLIYEKDKLITEKSEEHKEILEDHQLLKEDYIIKEIELERTNKAYAELKEEVYQYKERIRVHHEDIVHRLKQTEEVVKELAAYITSICKLTVGLYSIGNKSVHEIRYRLLINVEK